MSSMPALNVAEGRIRSSARIREADRFRSCVGQDWSHHWLICTVEL